MKWPLFENKIRKSLRSHQSEVDADAIWAAIEPQVDAMNRRKKRRFILFWFLLPGLLLSGMAFYVFYENNLELNTGEKPVNTDASIQNAISAQAVLNNKKSVSGTVLDEDCEDATTATSNHEDEIIAAQKTVLNTSVFKRKLAATHGKNQLKAALNPDILITGNSSQASQSLLNQPIAEQPQTAAVPSPIAGSSSLLSLPFPHIDPLAANMAEPQAKVVAQTAEMLPLRKRDFQWTGAVQASISFLDREMAATDSSFTALLDLRERYERQLEAVQVGIRFGLEHRSGLSLNTGLNYAQLNEVYKNNSTVVTLDSVYGIQYYYVDFEEDTIPVYGNIPLEKRTTYRKQFYNKYRLFEVPVLVGWRHEGHQFSFGAQAGVFVNLRMTTKGRVLQSASQDVDISKGNIYRTNIGLSYYFGLTAGFMLNDQLEVYASPFVRHFPKSFTKATYGLEQRYNLYGLNAGLAYRF